MLPRTSLFLSCSTVLLGLSLGCYAPLTSHSRAYEAFPDDGVGKKSDLQHRPGPQVVPNQYRAVAPVDTRSFYERIAELVDEPPETATFDRALHEFERTRPGLDPPDEQAHRDALEFLMAFMDERMEGVPVPDALGPAEVLAGGAFPSREVTALQMQTLADLTLSGVTFRYTGEGRYSPVLSYAGLLERLGPALSPLASTYLDIRAYELEKTVKPYRDYGFDGKPYDFVWTLRKWEEMAALPGAEVWEAEEHGRATLEHFLSICLSWSEWNAHGCFVTKKIRTAFKDCIEYDEGSRYQGVVKAFLAGTKAKKYRLSPEAHRALVDKVMKKFDEEE